MGDTDALLTGETGSQDVATQDQGAGSQEDMPAWAKSIMEDNARLRNEIRSAQGQANRAGQEAAQLRGSLSTLLTQLQSGKASPNGDTVADMLDDLKSLDQTDPGVRALTSALRKITSTFEQRQVKIEQSLGELKGHREAQQLTEQEQSIRDHNGAELAKLARRLGVTITPEIAAKIRSLPTGSMWDEGGDLIEEAAKKGQSDGKLKEVKESGAFSESRSTTGSGGINKARLKAEDIAKMTPQQYMKLNLTDEEEQAILARR